MKYLYGTVGLAIILGAVGLWRLNLDKPQNVGANEWTIQDVQRAVDAYYDATGEYIQVTQDKRLLKTSVGNININRLPDGWEIRPYQGPRGSGYVIEYVENDLIYTYGFGPEGEERTRVDKYEPDI